jgi:hypothetical protein
MPPPRGIPGGGGFFPVGHVSLKRSHDGRFAQGCARPTGAGSKAPPRKGSAYLLSLLPPKARPDKIKFSNARNKGWRLIQKARRAGKVPNALVIQRACQLQSPPPPIDAPCTQCLGHGDPMHAQERLTAAATASPVRCCCRKLQGIVMQGSTRQ